MPRIFKIKAVKSQNKQQMINRNEQQQYYYRRKLRANKMRRRIISAKNAIRNLRALVRVGLIFGFIYLGIWVLKLPQWFIDPVLLSMADDSVVKIEGNLITPKYKIIDLVKQTQLPHTQVFRLDTRELERNIAQLQPIKKVYVRRYWFPARLNVLVEERIPVFLIAPNLQTEPISAITIDGVFIDREYMPIPKKFKATKILTYGIRGDDYEQWDKKRVDEILKLIKTIEAYAKKEVKYVDLRNPKDVYVQIGDIMLRLGEINESIYNRTKWIATILPEAQSKYGRKIKYIDLRWEDARYIKLDNDMQRVEGNVKRDFSDNNIRENTDGSTNDSAQNSEGGVEFGEDEIL